MLTFQPLEAVSHSKQLVHTEIYRSALTNQVVLMFKGPVELAAVGVSIALFNQVSRIAIFPLVSVTTSFVAEEDTIGTARSEENESTYLVTDSSMNVETKQLIPETGIEYFLFLYQ